MSRHRLSAARYLSYSNSRPRQTAPARRRVSRSRGPLIAPVGVDGDPEPLLNIGDGEVEEIVTQAFGSRGPYLGGSLAPNDTEKLKAAPSGIGALSRL